MGKRDAGFVGCRIFGTTDTSVEVWSCGNAHAAVRTACSSRHAAARQRHSARQPPVPARPIESVHSIF